MAFWSGRARAELSADLRPRTTSDPPRPDAAFGSHQARSYHSPRRQEGLEEEPSRVVRCNLARFVVRWRRVERAPRAVRLPFFCSSRSSSFLPIPIPSPHHTKLSSIVGPPSSLSRRRRDCRPIPPRSPLRTRASGDSHRCFSRSTQSDIELLEHSLSSHLSLSYLSRERGSDSVHEWTTSCL